MSVRHPRRPALVRGLVARLRRFAALLLIVVAVEAVVDIANPFGIQDAIKAAAADTLQLVAAPFYGDGHDTPGQQVVTVVLIDPAYFRAIRPDGRVTWPMPVDLLALGVIRRIVDAGPAALFVDIGFPDAPREIVAGGTNSREQAIDQLAKRLDSLDPAVPIFLGDHLVPGREQQAANLPCNADFVPTDAIRSSNILAPRLLDHLFDPQSHPQSRPLSQSPGSASPDATGTARLEVVDASWPGTSAIYSLAPLMIGKGNCQSLKHDGQGYVPSPALALFKAFADKCPTGAAAICTRPAFRRLRDAISVPTTPPSAEGLRPYRLTDAANDTAVGTMAIRWGVRLSTRTRQFFRGAQGADACYDQFYGGGLEPIRNYLLHVFGPIARSMGRPTRRGCVYVDTISAADLVDHRRFESAAGGTGATHDADGIAKAFLKDRIVLLGVDLATAGDHFPSPINGTIPGVYIHAAAVENLVTRGDGYARGQSGFWQWMGMIVLGVFVLLGMTWLWERLCVRLSAWSPGWGRHLLAPLAYLASMFVLGSMLLVGLARTSLPLTEIAGPIITLHVILFVGVAENWKNALRARIGGTSPTPDGGEAPPA